MSGRLRAADVLVRVTEVVRPRAAARTGRGAKRERSCRHAGDHLHGMGATIAAREPGGG